VYVVQEGDNLFDIARYELGKATRWTDIVELNREALGANLDDLNYLTPGMKLILPQDRRAGQLTRNPGSLYQR
jgi:nucleoid-associated protein YgaU